MFAKQFRATLLHCCRSGEISRAKMAPCQLSALWISLPLRSAQQLPHSGNRSPDRVIQVAMETTTLAAQWSSWITTDNGPLVYSAPAQLFGNISVLVLLLVTTMTYLLPLLSRRAKLFDILVSNRILQLISLCFFYWKLKVLSKQREIVRLLLGIVFNVLESWFQKHKYLLITL